MDRITRYILANFAPLLLSLFFTLFFLVSVVFFITIARLTALISVSFVDLGEMYLYAIPEIFSYTLPVAYFISVAMTMFQMSKENEIIVLFALSLNPRKIAKPFFFVSFFVSAFLLFNAIFLVPLSKQMSSNFISMKKMEAKLNIKESEFGQKFSNWHVFVRSNNKKNYGDIVLFQKAKSGEDDKFILAKRAALDRNDSLLTLTLDGGSVYTLGDTRVTQVNYDKLKMNYNPKLHSLESSEIVAYWKEAKHNPKRAYQLAFSVLVSMFPFLTFLFALSFGIAHMRYHKPNVYLNSMIVVILYYVLIYQVSFRFPLYGSLLIMVLFSFASVFFFKKRIMERF
jgi:lipopolysaccharide export system permease protein